MSTFKYWSNKPQPWEYIENRFRTDFGGVHRRMVELVQHIRATGLATRLYGYSSMDKLVLSIDEAIDPRKEALHIEFDLISDQWRFEYRAMPFREPEFIRKYPSEEGIGKFDNFVKMVRW